VWPIERTDKQHKDASRPRAVHEAKVECDELGHLLQVRLKAAQEAGEDDQVAGQHARGGALRSQHRQERDNDHTDT
jgi:hypothetical protein